MSRINDALARALRDEHCSPEATKRTTVFTGAATDANPFQAGSQPELFLPEPTDQASDGVPRLSVVEGRERMDEPPPSGADSGGRELLDRVPHGLAEKLVIGPMPASSLEQYRRLAATLHQAHLNTGLRVVMITSAVAGEGKTLTSANLALTLSESYRRRVLLIDADLRRPTIHSVFGIPNSEGLTDALYTEGERHVATQRLSATLSVLTAGRPDTEQMAHLTSDRMRQLLQEATEIHDWVIIDTPPVALLSDAKLLAAMVDGAVLVIRAGVTPYPIVRRAIQAIGLERILGTVLNGAQASAIAGHTYYDRYGGYYPQRRPGWLFGRSSADRGRSIVSQPALPVEPE